MELGIASLPWVVCHLSLNMTLGKSLMLKDTMLMTKTRKKKNRCQRNDRSSVAWYVEEDSDSVLLAVPSLKFEDKSSN